MNGRECYGLYDRQFVNQIVVTEWLSLSRLGSTSPYADKGVFALGTVLKVSAHRCKS